MKGVLCIGEMLIDFICTDKGVSLQKSENFIKKCGGAPYNVSIAIQKLGANAYMCGSVGNDAFGETLINELKSYNVCAENVKSTNKNTTLAFVSLQEDGDRDFNFLRGADAQYSFNDIKEESLKSCSVFHFGSATAFLGDELNDTYDKALKYAVQNNKIITFDPNYRELLFGDKKDIFIQKSKYYIKYSDVVKVSDEEAFLITSEKEIEKAGKKIIEIGAKYVLITLGKEGTMIFHNDKVEHIKTEPVKMVDATGAGDAFIGTVISRIANDTNLNYNKMVQYVQLGNKVGGVVVQKYGALDAIPFIEEII